jgi:hypothetical protein
MEKQAEKELNVPQDMKDWIDNASYESMLYRWRFSPADSSSPWFQGEVGEYYAQVMFKKRDNDQYGAVLASKRVGWEKK